MSKRYLGNIITNNPTAPTDNFETTSANGVWSLTEAKTLAAAGQWPTDGNPAPIGLFAQYNNLNKIDLTTTGNATDFGQLSNSYNCGACSSTRMVVGRTTMTYVEFSTGGTQTTFGSFSDAISEVCGLANDTRGIYSGGNRISSGYDRSSAISYITIATTGSVTSFGSLTEGSRGGGAFSSTTRGVMSIGFNNSEVNTINYVTIATTGNATDFGDMTQGRTYAGGCGSSTRGLWGGGGIGSTSNIIDYVTIATTGNATDFGNLTQARREGPTACSSKTRGVWGGGYVSSAVDTMDYVTIATTGNATDYGDLLAAAYGITGGSNGHGGLA